MVAVLVAFFIAIIFVPLPDVTVCSAVRDKISPRGKLTKHQVQSILFVSIRESIRIVSPKGLEQFYTPATVNTHPSWGRRQTAKGATNAISHHIKMCF